MLDTIPIPDSIPAVEQLTIKQIVGTPREYTTELLRLFNSYPHDKDHLKALGIKKDEMSAHLVAGLPRPGGTIDFYPDLYGLDAKLAGLLEALPAAE